VSAAAEDPAPPVNKLLYMYDFYYLPFSITWREGRTVNDIIPLITDKPGEPSRLLKAEELQSLDKDWNAIKERWKKRSLLLSTQVDLNQSVHISQRLVSHHIPLSRGPFDTISITDRIQLNDALKTKSPEVQATFKQLRFLKSFLQPLEEEKFNFFIISASWCDSCKEYRILLETYMKTFPSSGLVLHSVVIEDPKEEIFDAKILKELFPHPNKYTHDSIPRFLAIETVQGKTALWEEGEALKELYERFYKEHRGFLDSKTQLFKSNGARLLASPQLSSLLK
jgi:thiol-disulfide isomerase/thioredoxin